ncbi:MAG: hypothetical protein EZS28_011918 [Streblomastix strix]|uniref:Uncharacterized protein n=1 Tax=Streblomastix strix TaxID=222440 RepID=A0A5J4WDN9_9EUKA|nr:MAG: hypothetical protein EZS28_011918 [Streblomastix strix]
MVEGLILGTNQNSIVKNLPLTFIFHCDRNYWIPTLDERVQDLDFNIDYQSLVDNLGYTRVHFFVSLEHCLEFQDFKIVRTVLISPGKRYPSQYSIAMVCPFPLQQDVQQSGANFVMDIILNLTDLHRWLRYRVLVLRHSPCCSVLNSTLLLLLPLISLIGDSASRVYRDFMHVDYRSVACVLIFSSCCTFHNSGIIMRKRELSWG